MSVFFISDLHLDVSRQEITNRFLQFLQVDAKDAEALYILGDFFEVYIGQEGLNAHDKQVMQALSLYAAAIPTYFLPGNRDFLITREYLKQLHITLLPDPFVIELYDKKLVLMHGDTLCTEDIAYQRFRRFVRHPMIQWLYLNLPLFLRQKIAQNLRKASHETQHKASHEAQHHTSSNSNNSNLNQNLSKYDATQQAIDQAFTTFHMDILIHGHTHKPEIQSLSIAGKQGSRIVLGDWGKRSTILEYTASGPILRVLDLSDRIRG